MFRNKFVAMVIPAHNESRHISEVIETAPALVDMLVVVDDGSTDSTAEVVRSLRNKRTVLLRHAQNRGVGAAIVSGYRFALDEGADVIGVMGGDGQMDTSHLPALLEPIIEGQCDFTKGNRFFSWQSWRGMPIHRAIGNVILSLLSKVASGYWHIFDCENGYTMISSTMLRRLPLHRLETGYQFENRLLIQLSISGARILDIPIPARYGDEDSGIRLWHDVPAILWALVSGFGMRVRQKYLGKNLSAPGTLFLSGLLFLMLGIGLIVLASLPVGPSWMPTAALICASLAAVLLVGFAVMDFFIGRRALYPRRPAEQAEIVTVPDSPVSATGASFSAERE